MSPAGLSSVGEPIESRLGELIESFRSPSLSFFRPFCDDFPSEKYYLTFAIKQVLMIETD